MALDAYPWNWVPIVDWERDMQSGYLFGIDPYGRIGLHAAIAGSWYVLSSSAKVPLKRWTHVAAAFDPARGMTLYIDGRKAGELAVTGALTPPEKTDQLIGRVRDKMMPVPSGLIHPKHTIYYSLEGVLDELTIHGRTLDAAEIGANAAAVKIADGMSSPWPVMPAGAAGPGRFGAYYETLKFQDTWDRLRRIGPEPDVVVQFPQSGMRLVFWQGNNNVPAWDTENGKWYTDQFMEAYGKPNAPTAKTANRCPTAKAATRARAFWRAPMHESWSTGVTPCRRRRITRAPPPIRSPAGSIGATNIGRSIPTVLRYGNRFCGVHTSTAFGLAIR